MSYQKVYMNQVHSSTLLSQLAQMWKSQLLCDAIIKTGTVTTKAHRLVLVAACPMLQSMENASVGSHLEVRLAAEIKQDSVNTFLQYLYEGFMMLTEENVRDVEKVARLLQVESIITCCSDFDKCLRAKNGSLPPNAPYKYNFADLVEFRHVRTTDLQKTVQERMMKRAAEMSRPSSPGNKRQRMHKPSSESHSDSYIGANRTDDSLSMSQSYMSSGGGGSSGGSQWDRVPRIGTSRPGRDSHHMPGVIDIVDDSIELVQTEPPEKGGGKIDSKSVQKSVSVSISSQISASDVQVVNVTDSETSSKPSVTPTPSSSSSRGSITVSPLTIFDSPAGRDTSTNKSQDSKKDESRQTDSGQSQRSDSYSSQRSDSQIPQRSDNHQSQRSPFPVALSSVQGSGQSKQFGPSGGQAKPFAAGSATQASYSHSSPVSSAPSTSSPASHSMNRNENLDRGSPAEKSKSNLKHKEPPESSTADMTPDLSIVKIESRNAEIDTGGLDMYVDMPEHGVMQLHRRSDDDQGEHSDIEYEEPSGDWSREDMSNEGSNISGDQNNSWYVGTFKESGAVYYTTGNYKPVMNQVESWEDYSTKPDEYTDSLSINKPTHRLVHLKRNKRSCAYCNICRLTTKSGWAIKSYYICEACGVPLCRGQKDCFTKFHELLAQNEGMSPELMIKKLKPPKPKTVPVLKPKSMPTLKIRLAKPFQPYDECFQNIQDLDTTSDGGSNSTIMNFDSSGNIKNVAANVDSGTTAVTSVHHSVTTANLESSGDSTNVQHDGSNTVAMTGTVGNVDDKNIIFVKY